MKVAFRCDASLDIGTGHVARCLTLAIALRDRGADCRFIARLHPGHLNERIADLGFAVTALPAGENPLHALTNVVEREDGTAHVAWLGCSWEEDAAQCRAMLSEFRPDWLVVDHYALDERWEALVKSDCRKVMVIDDLADRRHNCELLLDQNLGHMPQDYAKLVPTDCKVLAGPAYALLRPEFARLRSYSLERRRDPQMKRLLVAMGGVDQQNSTGQVLDALKKCPLPADCKIWVVMGQHAPWLDQVRAQSATMPWSTEVLVNIEDMARRMADSDLAIGAAGGTSWERCCLGLPSIVLVLAENQKEIAIALADVGAAKVVSAQSLAQDIQNILGFSVNTAWPITSMSANAAKVTDGKGATLVADCLRG
jgi:UDP-2,4-diacetamido-2,4,6-trideoxy-beta-L-altropyranose hydrolase